VALNEDGAGYVADQVNRPVKEKISQSLAHMIIRDVNARHLQPGDRLPSEVDMLAQYGVARSSLREGLRILEILGLIEIRTGPSGGPIVRNVDVRDFARTTSFYLQVNGLKMGELVEARLDLEPMLAAKAAGRQEPELLNALRTAIERADTALTADDMTWATASFSFHRAITSFSGNRVLDFMAGGLSEIYLTRLKAAVVPMEGREGVQATHREIASSIAAGRVAKAERLMKTHMAEYAESIARRHPHVMDTAIDWE
jgi:GntR family transcriptional repressor for pyruvate dehydrogenase complex